MNTAAEALAELTKIDQLDYGSSLGCTESATYYELQDYRNLIESSRRALLLDPNDWFCQTDIFVPRDHDSPVQVSRVTLRRVHGEDIAIADQRVH